METSQLLLGVIFSSIGLGYLIYGAKQRVSVPFVCGLILMIFPYYAGSIGVLVLVGAVLSATPYFVKI
ncbi:amino acid transport protein [Alkanindiges sp. WGS2144]|uniref:amino acid transport protein n=1 Tax=Alkanindiges sp. WGS2144 TaxID=3366808 RepID=UPI003752164A